MPKENCISIEGCLLSREALATIKDIQEDKNQGLKNMRDDLTELLVEVIQSGAKEDQRSKFISVLADSIELVHLLHAK